MKILIVSSCNAGYITPFVQEQSDSLSLLGVQVSHYLIKGKGIKGYLKNLKPLIKTIKNNKIDLVHAHYGFSGLLSVMQRIVPVVITFHGCDVNRISFRIFSKIAVILARHAIFVNDTMVNKMKLKKNFSVVPCGIDIDFFKPLDKNEARQKMGLNKEKTYVLFSSSFDRPEKNVALAREALKKLPEAGLLELKGYSREECLYLFNAVDLLLLTSFREGSPQVVKEAITCNCPVVSTDVGNVKMLIDKVEGCFICSFDPQDVTDKINKALSVGKSSNGKERLIELKLDSISTAKKLLGIYKEIKNELL